MSSQLFYACGGMDSIADIASDRSSINAKLHRCLSGRKYHGLRGILGGVLGRPGFIAVFAVCVLRLSWAALHNLSLLSKVSTNSLQQSINTQATHITHGLWGSGARGV